MFEDSLFRNRRIHQRILILSGLKRKLQRLIPEFTFINMGYGLQQNYADVFNEKANTEIIYAVPTNAAQPNFWITEVLSANFASTIEGKIARSSGWYVYWIP